MRSVRRWTVVAVAGGSVVSTAAAAEFTDGASRDAFLELFVAPDSVVAFLPDEPRYPRDTPRTVWPGAVTLSTEQVQALDSVVEWSQSWWVGLIGPGVPADSSAVAYRFHRGEVIGVALADHRGGTLHLEDEAGTPLLTVPCDDIPTLRQLAVNLFPVMEGRVGPWLRRVARPQGPVETIDDAHAFFGLVAPATFLERPGGYTSEGELHLELMDAVGVRFQLRRHTLSNGSTMAWRLGRGKGDESVITRGSLAERAAYLLVYYCLLRISYDGDGARAFETKPFAKSWMPEYPELRNLQEACFILEFLAHIERGYMIRGFFLFDESRDAVRQLTWGPGTAEFPSWSPDGREIAFASRVGRQWEVMTIGADGGPELNLTADPAADSSPRWSPDGSRITFTRDRGGEGGTGSDVWMMEVGSRSAFQLTDDTEGEFGPSWSPDGSRVVYVRYNGPQEGTDLWTVDAATRERARLTEDRANDLQPAWSPDGRSILFVSDREGGWGLWLLLLDGRTLSRIPSEPGPIENPAWSRDGSRVCYTRQGDIRMMPAAGGSETRLTLHPAWDGHASWSPDGARIVFSSSRGGSLNLWVMDLTEEDPE